MVSHTPPSPPRHTSFTPGQSSFYLLGRSQELDFTNMLFRQRTYMQGFVIRSDRAD